MEKKTKKKQLIEFELDFSEQQPHPTNPMFSYGKARIFYKGHNRNGSHFGEESVKKAMPTLHGIPIVGEFDEETGNFKGHGGKIEITDDGVEFIDTTVPFGHISEKSNFYWETVEHMDGTKKDYLVADKCIFWTGRYPQLNGLFKNGAYNQSMEIEVTNGEFAVIDGEETFRIDDFVFSALCILGISTPDDPDGHVEPCFEESKIGIYTGQNSFTNKYNFMMEELNKEGGGQEMTKENKASFTSKQLEVKFTAELAKGEEKYSYLDHTDTLVMFADESGKVLETEFSITEENLSVDIENKKESEYALTEEEVAVVNAKYSALEETVKTTQESLATMTTEKETVEAEFAAAKSEHETAINTLTSDFETFKVESATQLSNLETEKENFKVQAEKVEGLETEIASLREFKRTAEENGIVEKFSGKLEEDVLTKIVSDNAGKTVEEIEGLIFAEIGKANFSMMKDEKPAPKGIGVHNEPEKTSGRYSQLAEKYKQ